MLDGGANRDAVVIDEPEHQRIVPLLCALAEGDAGNDGSDEHGEAECADQGEADGPGHRLEEPALNGLEVKMGR